MIKQKNRPEVTGIGLMEQIDEKYKFEHNTNIDVPMSENTIKAVDDAIRSEIDKMELVKTVQVEDDIVVNETYHGDMKELSPMSKEEQYEALMNIFLNRKDKRKLNRAKGKLSFTDRIYKNIKK